MNYPSDIDLLLVGKTGNGKSATGNSILGCNLFKSKASMISVTSDIQFSMCEFQGRTIKVVDAPGLADTRLDTEKDVQSLKGHLEYAIALNPRGYHAIVLVIKYGCRFTDEEKDTVKFLKGLFGSTFIQDYGILVVTNGDTFDKENQDKLTSFKQWCNEQKGDFADILKECNKRVVLFNNIQKDTDIRERQLRALMLFVDEIQSHRKPYTDVNFNLAQDAKEKIIAASRKPLLTEKMLKEASLITQKLNNIQADRMRKDWSQDLENLMVRVDALHDSVDSQNRGGGDLDAMVKHTTDLKKSISQEIKFCVKKREEYLVAMKEKREQELIACIEQLAIDLIESYSEANKKHNEVFVSNVAHSVNFPLNKFAWM